jgi:putative addiction module killer protein
LFEIFETDEYQRWFEGLRDLTARSLIAARIRRLSLGNRGDAKSVGAGVMELRVDYGPGYRIYFIRQGEAVIVLLAGGDKSNQSRDIEQARALAEGL